MRLRLALASAVLCLQSLSAVPAGADPAGHVTGVGGVFIKSKNPKALANWYRDVLGLEIMPWGGAILAYDAPGHPHVLAWSPFPETT